MDEIEKGTRLAEKVKAALEKRRAKTRLGFVVVLGSAPREGGEGVKHGVGRSALADRLAHVLEAQRLSTGKVFRDMARERELSIEAFHRMIPKHPQWDADLDRRVMKAINRARAEGEFLVLDSNLAAIFGGPDLAVCVDVPDPVRARRVLTGNRYGDRAFATADEALAFLDGRSAEEAQRYREHPDPLYEGVDLADPSAYLATVDNSGALEEAVEEVLGLILEVLGAEGGSG